MRLCSAWPIDLTTPSLRKRFVEPRKAHEEGGGTICEFIMMHANLCYSVVTQTDKGAHATVGTV